MQEAQKIFCREDGKKIQLSFPGLPVFPAFTKSLRLCFTLRLCVQPVEHSILVLYSSYTRGKGVEHFEIPFRLRSAKKYFNGATFIHARFIAAHRFNLPFKIIRSLLTQAPVNFLIYESHRGVNSI